MATATVRTTRRKRSSRPSPSSLSTPRSACSANLSRPLRTGTERPASRPREGREGDDRNLESASGHRSSESGGLFSARGPADANVTSAGLPVPPDSVVDPRIGAHGPALLTFEDGTVFHGV